jgi:hypothetical protein
MISLEGVCLREFWQFQQAIKSPVFDCFYLLTKSLFSIKMAHESRTILLFSKFKNLNGGKNGRF